MTVTGYDYEHMKSTEGNVNSVQKPSAVNTQKISETQKPDTPKTSGNQMISDDQKISSTQKTSGTSGTQKTSGTSGTSGTQKTSGTSGTSGTQKTSGTSTTQKTSGTSGSSNTKKTSGTSTTQKTSGSSTTQKTSSTSGTSSTQTDKKTSGAPGASDANDGKKKGEKIVSNNENVYTGWKSDAIGKEEMIRVKNNESHIPSEDDVINDDNGYHSKMKPVDLVKNVRENIILLLVILIPIVGMYALFRLRVRGCLMDGTSKSNTMFSLLTVSLLMTVSETIFVYWYNIERVHNNIVFNFEQMFGFQEYLTFKKINANMPNVVHSEFKKSYEKNLQSITFIMFLPIFLICIFMMSILTGCMSLNYKDVLGIIINVLLLITVFGVTFVNLGIKQSAPIDLKKLAETFDPFDDVHRFQTTYNMANNNTIKSLLGGFFGSIIAFIVFVYMYK